MPPSICPNCLHFSPDEESECPNCRRSPEVLSGAELIAHLKEKKSAAEESHARSSITTKKSGVDGKISRAGVEPKSKNRKRAIVVVFSICLAVTTIRQQNFNDDLGKAENLIFSIGSYQQALDILNKRPVLNLYGGKRHELLFASASLGRTVASANKNDTKIIKGILTSMNCLKVKNSFPNFYEKQVAHLLSNKEKHAAALLVGEGNILNVDQYISSEEGLLLQDHSLEFHNDLVRKYNTELEHFITNAKSLLANEDDLLLFENYMGGAEGQFLKQRDHESYSMLYKLFSEALETLLVARARHFLNDGDGLLEFETFMRSEKGLLIKKKTPQTYSLLIRDAELEDFITNAKSLLANEDDLLLFENYMVGAKGYLLKRLDNERYITLYKLFSEALETLLVARARHFLDKSDGLLEFETFMLSDKGLLIKKNIPKRYALLIRDFTLSIEHRIVSYLSTGAMGTVDGQPSPLLPDSVQDLFMGTDETLYIPEVSAYINICRELQNALNSEPASKWRKHSFSDLGRQLNAYPLQVGSYFETISMGHPLAHHVEHIKKHYSVLSNMEDMENALGRGDARGARSIMEHKVDENWINNNCRYCIDRLNEYVYGQEDSLITLEDIIRAEYSENLLALIDSCARHIKESIDCFGNEVIMTCCSNSLQYHLDNTSKETNRREEYHTPVAVLKENNSMKDFIAAWASASRDENALRNLYKSKRVVVLPISESLRKGTGDELFMPRLSSAQTERATFRYGSHKKTNNRYLRELSRMQAHKPYWGAIVIENEVSLTMSGAIDEPWLSGYILHFSDDYYSFISESQQMLEDKRLAQEQELENKRVAQERNRIRYANRCRSCDGDGRHVESRICGYCGGRGDIGLGYFERDCNQCGWEGDSLIAGRVAYYVRCQDCGGTGQMR